jgi:WD40 repeat protein
VDAVFISYARADAEPYAEWLHAQLTARGRSVWWDHAAMKSRGRTFLQEIRDAIEGCDRLLLVVTPAAVASEYVRAEWNHALLFGKNVICLRRIGGVALVPPELGKLHAVDASDTRDASKALDEIERHLAEPLPPLGRFRSLVPSLPPRFLPRRSDLEALEQSVLADVHRPTVVTSARQTAALQGMGGVGKSVLTAAFARATDTRRAFADGIVWLSVGASPDLLGICQQLGQGFDDDPAHYTTLAAAQARLPRALADQVALLILDDVWQLEAVTPVVSALGPRCRLLVTTRDASIAAAMGAVEHRLGTLGPDEARRLLADWTTTTPQALPPAAAQVIEECGGLPLALAICGGMVRSGVPWTDLAAALREADLSFLEQALKDYPHRSVVGALKVSLDMLARESPEAAHDFQQLAVFDADERVPEAAVLTLWNATKPPRDRAARKLLSTLGQKALIQLEGEAPNRLVSLHDLQRDVLQALTPDMPALHAQLLERYVGPGGTLTSVPRDGYFHRHAVRHLVAAGRADDALTLLRDFRWISACHETGELSGYLADAARFPKAFDLWLVGRALRMSGHALTLGRGQLPSQLWGRLWMSSMPEIHSLLAQAGEFSGEPWLRGRLTGLIAASMPLERVVNHDLQIVNTVALSADGGHAITSDDNSEVRVWDLTDLWSPTIRLPSRLVDGIGGWVQTSATHPREARAAMGDEDGNVFLLDLRQAAILARVTCDGPVAEVLWSPDGTMVWIGLANARVLSWDGSAAPTLIWEASLASLTALVMTGDGVRLFAGGDGGVRACDLQAEVETEVELPEAALARGGTVSSLAVTTDGSLLIAGSNKGAIVCIDLTGPREARLLAAAANDAHEDISALVITPDGRRLVAVSWNRMMRMWDLPSLRAHQPIRAHAMSIYDVDTFAEARWVLTGSKDSTLRFWDLEAWSTAPPEADLQLRHDSGVVDAIGASEQTGHVVTSALDGSVILWDQKTLRPLWSVTPLDSFAWVGSTEIDAERQSVLVRAGNDLVELDLTTGATKGPVRIGNATEKDDQSSLALAPGGRLLLVFGTTTARLFVRRGDSFVAGRTVDCVGRLPAFSGDATHLAVLGVDRVVRVLALATGDVRLALPWPSDDAQQRRQLALDHSARRLTLIDNRRIAVHEVATGQQAWEVERAHEDGITFAVYSPDSTLLCTGSWDFTFKIWNAANGSLVTTYVGDEAWGRGLFLADSRRLVAGGVNGTVHFLDLMAFDSAEP